MHFHSLAVIRVPEVEANPEWEEKHAEKVQQLEQLVQMVPGNLVAQIELCQVCFNNEFVIPL